MKKYSVTVLILLGVMLFGYGLSAAAPVPTPYELSGKTETPRYAETMAWLTRLAESSETLRLESFGRSGEGRSLPLVIAASAGHFAVPGPADRADRAVVLVQACIHAGESCGKDAGMILLRDLVAGTPETAGLLDKVTLLFIPIFNVDGHERFSAYNRINQNGPREMGWRVTSRNQNLNRDYLKADLPEMRAWLKLYNKWLPDFFIDIHATDGADYQYPITYSVETNGNMDPGLTAWVTRYEEAMVDEMRGDGYPMAPYVSFRKWHDPASGLQAWAAGPRFSQGYTALQNRPGLLIETHMLKPYPVRVDSARKLVIHSLRWCGAHAAELRGLELAADAFAASADFRTAPFPLSFTSTGDSIPFEFLGVEYETVKSAVTGGEWNRFSSRKVTREIPYFNTLKPEATAQLPAAYLIPPQWTEAIARLEAHGIRYTRLSEPAEYTVSTWKFTHPKWQEKPYEGHHPVTFEAEPLTETRTYPAGTVRVDMNQRAARVIAHLLEPKGPDSLVQWGYFDSIFERVEYVESYVIEQMIPSLLAEHPEWEGELAAAKAADPEFAGDPWAIRYWFYARTPYYDSRVGVYPVGGVGR